MARLIGSDWDANSAVRDAHPPDPPDPVPPTAIAPSERALQAVHAEALAQLPRVAVLSLQLCVPDRNTPPDPVSLSLRSGGVRLYNRPQTDFLSRLSRLSLSLSRARAVSVRRAARAARRKYDSTVLATVVMPL